MVNVRLPVLTPLLLEHSDHCKFIKSVNDFIWLPATTPSLKPYSNTYRMCLVASAATSSSGYHTTRATLSARYEKFIPFSTQFHELNKLALPITATTKYLKPLTTTSSRMATILPTRLTKFCRCYHRKCAHFISCCMSVFYCISLNQIPSHQRQVYA